MLDLTDVEQTVTSDMDNWSESSSRDESHAADQAMMDLEKNLVVGSAKLNGPNFKSLHIGLINFHRFAEDCLTRAFDDLHPHTSISSFMTEKDLAAEASDDLDFMIYYLHASESSDAKIMQAIATICEVLPAVPLMVFTDADPSQQARLMRASIKSGARGFVPTQTAGLAITLAAIRLVSEGGVYVPADLMSTNGGDGVPARKSLLTSRQMDVLSHLQQGKANKIIAYDLGMSESTVKVHIRNIMRKMGATNRTQVVYKANMNDMSPT
jgi:DNA-binding NarL/FixJ family response regulator